VCRPIEHDYSLRGELLAKVVVCPPISEADFQNKAIPRNPAVIGDMIENIALRLHATNETVQSTHMAVHRLLLDEV
jgi:hypothetical protein